MKDLIKKFIWKRLKSLVRRYGIVLVLGTLADQLMESKKTDEKQLGKDIQEALNKFKNKTSTFTVENYLNSPMADSTNSTNIVFENLDEDCPY